MPNEIAFILIAVFTVACAVAAMTRRQLVHCALFAAAAFAGLAALYLQLDAEFVGFAQLMVYVGAIAILIVFTVLLTRGDEVRSNRSQSSPSWLAGVAVAVLVLAGIALPILLSPALWHAAPVATGAPVKRIGEEVMNRYVLPLEMVGVLLTGALLGAVVIAMREEPAVKPPSRSLVPARAESEEVVNLR
jgi:NADH-quinone oxidoreductase subunit J